MSTFCWLFRRQALILIVDSLKNKNEKMSRVSQRIVGFSFDQCEEINDDLLS